MTYEEAIRKIESQKLQFLEEYVDYSGVSEAYDMAINALKEKLPKKPIENKGNAITEFKCPRCRDVIAYKVNENFMFSALLENNICRCGQEIDWSEVKEK